MDASNIIVFIHTTVSHNPSPLATRYRGQCPCKYYLDLVFCRVHPHISCTTPVQSKTHFVMVAKILRNLQSTQSCKILMKFFFHLNLHTRMHGKFGEFFLEFFDLKISIYRFFFFFFWRQVSEACSFWTVTYCHMFVLFHNY